MKQYNVAEAKAHLSELIDLALQGEEVVIARDNRPLVMVQRIQQKKQRVPGHAKKDVIFVAPDFDKTPDDFNEYA